MESAWDISTGVGVTVAVVDTGVAYEDNGSTYKQAPDLANTSFAPGYDFVNNDTHPNDDEGHGTHVAGTIAQSTNNNEGTAAVAHGASIMPVKVLNSSGSGSYFDIANGIIFAADMGADVINLSLGGSGSSQTLENAIAYAYNSGVTIVAAAGNNGTNSLLYPAAYNQYVIAAGATRYDEALAPYSNYGAGLDVVAPGGDLNVDQNGDGYGDGVVQQTFQPRCVGRFFRRNCSYDDFGYYLYQGTSMATPHVAGVAALVIANGNASTPDDVRSAIEETADDLGLPGWDNTYGNGLVNAPAALAWSSGGSPSPPPPPPPEPEPENEPPTANAGSDHSAETGESINFDGSGSSDDGVVVSYDWDFDDGTTATGTFVNHTYTSSGTYTVTLSVTDDGGLGDSDTAIVTVSETAPPPPPPPPPGDVEVFSDSFEVSEWNGLWSENSQNGWYRSSQRSTDGNYSAEVDGDEDGGTLTSIPIDLQGKTNVSISYDWYIERRLDRGEYVAFDISTDGGNTWTEYRRLRGNIDQENAWHSVSVNLSSINSLRLRFRGAMSKRSEDADVDNVSVTAS